MLGTQINLKWKQNKSGLLTVDLSDIPVDKLNALEHVWVLKIDNYNTHF